MIKLLIPVFALIAITTFISCTKGGNSPEKTLNNFLTAVNNRNWEEAKKYATKESESMLDMVKGFADMMPDSTSTAMKFEIIDDKTVEDENTAQVVAKDENQNEITYKLKKIDGDWKVDFTMEALMGDMNMENPVDESVNSMDNMADSMMIENDPMMRDSMIK